MSRVRWVLKWRASGEYFKGHIDHYAFWGERRAFAMKFKTIEDARGMRAAFNMGGLRMIAICKLTRKTKN